MDEKRKKSVSKFLSLILRHRPEIIGLDLDENGWASIEELLVKLAKGHNMFTREELIEVVSTNDKQRFIFNEDITRIRANQGHSLNIDLELMPIAPPEFLFHGTVDKFLSGISAQGLKKMSRQHVHLSEDRQTAEKVGGRRGSPVILIIASGKMFDDGYRFYRSENGVWLTEEVPVQYIDLNSLLA